MSIYYFMMFLLLYACSAPKPKTVVDLNQRLSGRSLTTMSQPVTGSAEAEEIMNRKQSYHQSLFEQSFDPYYGTPRYDEACLKENFVGNVMKTNRVVVLPMTLALNQSFEPGFCTNSTTQSSSLHHMVYYHCRGSSIVNRLIVPAKPGDENLDWEQLCQ
ncbi:MAG: hypothetical protein LW878_01005 [Proteobacteria bacterium]|nr:hypothetical protein [Pseudomonadota bacterium]